MARPDEGPFQDEHMSDLSTQMPRNFQICNTTKSDNHIDEGGLEIAAQYV